METVIERFVEVPDGHLYARTCGEGQDVLLLHAGAADLRMWDLTIAWLSGIARVTAFDFRDMGLSSRARRPYSELDDIAAVLDAVGAGPAVLVGVSDGARRALAFAHDRPGRVAHVVAAGGAFGDFPDPTPAEEAARQVMREHVEHLRSLPPGPDRLPRWAEADIAAWGPALDPDARRKMIALQLANAYWIELEASLGTELTPPVSRRFAEQTVPVAVVVGERDFAATRLWGERLARLAPGATLTVLPGADHFPMLSAPAAFAGIVRAAVAAADKR